ncbi:MAG: sporulation protein YqfD, partial [Eubacteriales bacterium]|nr:sporulation protein YqfD [Eubacteriales bacterium]
MTKRIWQFLQGYAKIQIDGTRLVSWLCALSAQGITLRSMRRLSHTSVQALVSRKDCTTLLKMAEKAALRVQILAEYGLPKLTRPLLRRGVLAAGLPVLAALLYAVNLFVLQVEVTGCDDEALCQQILMTARQCGVYPGAAKGDFDRLDVQKQLSRQVEGLSFVSIAVRGVKATIDVQQEVPAPPLLDKDHAYELVADRDAVVYQVVAVAGEALVAPGDLVRAGQVLVSHILPMSDGSVKAVHAQGRVLARVWYEARAWQPLLAVDLQRSGRTATRRYLQWGGVRLQVDGHADSYEWYETQTSSRYLLGSAGPQLITQTDWELVRQDAQFPEEIMKAKALAEAQQKAHALLPAQAQLVDSIIRCHVDEQGRLWAEVSLEVL